VPTNFGKDTSCTTGLRSGRYATGAKLVAEACFRRLTTPRGMLRGGDDEANYGLDLTELIGSASTKLDAAALGARIKAELLKDERLINVTVDVVRTLEGPSVSFDVTIYGETDAGPFDLQIGVDEVTVELLGIEAD
jgi:hypothetical protein